MFFVIFQGGSPDPCLPSPLNPRMYNLSSQKHNRNTHTPSKMMCFSSNDEQFSCFLKKETSLEWECFFLSCFHLDMGSY